MIQKGKLYNIHLLMYGIQICYNQHYKITMKEKKEGNHNF